jgi:hypothetical protein
MHQETRYPGIGMLILLIGSSISWALIVLTCRLLYHKLVGYYGKHSVNRTSTYNKVPGLESAYEWLTDSLPSITTFQKEQGQSNV